MVYGLSELEALIHPWVCLCCGAPGQPGLDLCPACAAELPRWDDARPDAELETGLEPIIPFRYAFPIDRLIVGLKFAGRLERARLLGALLAAHAATRFEALDPGARPIALIAAPLHPARLRQRGFNQALEIARPVAARLGLPLLRQAVSRVRATAEQTLLDAAARRDNLRGAFAVRGAPPTHVAILDDVVTTGATAAALASALREAGAERVTLLAVARAV